MLYVLKCLVLNNRIVWSYSISNRANLLSEVDVFQRQRELCELASLPSHDFSKDGIQ